MSQQMNSVPCLLWPFWALWRLVTGVLALMGRLVAVLLGVAFMAVGVILSLTIIGAIVGVPMFLFGLVLVVRGLF